MRQVPLTRHRLPICSRPLGYRPSPPRMKSRALPLHFVVTDTAVTALDAFWDNATRYITKGNGPWC